MTSETYGPYNTFADVEGTELHQHRRAIEATTPTGRDDRKQEVRAMQAHHLFTACQELGVELGGLDKDVLNQLATEEAAVVQSIIGIIHRAHQAGRLGAASDH